MQSKSRIDKLMGKAGKSMSKDYDEMEKQKEERRQKKIQNKILGKTLGDNKAICNHIDAYSSSFKELLNEITDEQIIWTQMGKVANTNDGNTKLDAIMNNNNEDPDDRKQRLAMQIVKESSRYYQNNLNMFSNGLSLMSVNALEIHRKLSQLDAH